MSFSLAVADGDIALRGSNVGLVSGVEKLQQDVSIWLRERYGSDRFQSNYGSVLDSFIGSVIDDRTSAMVQSEVMRVLRNYQQVQRRAIDTNPQRFSADEILLQVEDIRTDIRYDSVNVTIRFLTGSRQIGQLSVGLGI